MKVIVACILMLASTVSGAAATQVAVVAHPSVEERDLDSRRLLDIFTGAIKTWSGGVPIILVDHKEKTDAKVAFYDYLGMSASRLKSIWMKNLLAGEGTPPESIAGEDELLKRIASTPGALGYVSLSKARESNGVVILLEITEGER
jgi:ABC-type phosphate transport system substrate-binding protein